MIVVLGRYPEQTGHWGILLAEPTTKIVVLYVFVLSSLIAIERFLVLQYKMPRPRSKNPSKSLCSNPSLALPNPSLPSQASLLLDVPLHDQTSTNSNNESNSAASKRSRRSSSSRQSTKAYRRQRSRKEMNEKKLEKVLQYLSNSKITFERLLTELCLNWGNTERNGLALRNLL